jgi:hypothetical protein
MATCSDSCKVNQKISSAVDRIVVMLLSQMLDILTQRFLNNCSASVAAQGVNVLRQLLMEWFHDLLQRPPSEVSQRELQGVHIM